MQQPQNSKPKGNVSGGSAMGRQSSGQPGNKTKPSGSPSAMKLGNVATPPPVSSSVPADAPQLTQAVPQRPENATPAEIADYLAAQVQGLATRLEALRQQGAGKSTEFRQLEQMLAAIQFKLMQAQSRIAR